MRNLHYGNKTSQSRDPMAILVELAAQASREGNMLSSGAYFALISQCCNGGAFAPPLFQITTPMCRLRSTKIYKELPANS